MKTVTIAATVPAEFARRAKRDGLAPEYLASLVLCKFCEEPAGELYIVSRQPDLTKAESAVGDHLVNRAWCSADEDLRPLRALLKLK
jgi:hypothetical protein